MNASRALLYLAAVLLVFSSCRKDKDDQDPPTVSFIAPMEGSTLAVPDTFLVSVSVSDNKEVRSVSVQLLNSSGIPVLPTVTRSVNAASALVSVAMILTSEQLVSGTYSLEVRASDGSNDGRAFRTIYIQGAPWRLRSVYITSPIGAPGNALISCIDSVGQLSTWSLSPELGGAAIDARSQLLFTCGTFTGALMAQLVGPGGAGWTTPNLHSGAGSIPYFLGLRLDPSDGRLYTGTEDGRIRGWTAEGSSTFNATTVPGNLSHATAVVGGKVISEQVGTGSGLRALVTHAYSSGALLGQFALNMDVLEIYARNDQNALLFGTRDGLGVIQDRNVDLGGTFEIREFAEGPIHAVAQLNTNTYIIAYGDRLARWSYQTDDLSTLATGITAQALAYEPATGALYVGVGNELRRMDPNTGALVDATSLQHPVGAILPLRNR
ncbi:MAG: hypothetical protein JNL52_04720 [Flavobacteriales bacterium]|nr:hypothetical protein [Flavobacteriales bacterium]